MAMAHAEGWQQDAENDQNPNPIAPAPEVAIAAVVADDPIEYEEGFIPLEDVNMPDERALYVPPPVEDSPE